MPTCDECHAKLDFIISLLQSRRKLASDITALAQILPAIVGTFGSAAITTRDILRDPAIRVIAPNSGSLGILLSRAAENETEAGGYIVTKIAKEHGACVWVVLKRLPPLMDKPEKARSNGRGGN